MERVLNGRYRVGPKIGDGGMAMVYRGYDTLLGRSVAIKVLRDQYAADPQFLARFEREAQAVAALTHPNIVNIFDVGVDTAEGDACHYFVMEFIDGPNLKEIIRARGPLPVDETVAIVVQVLAGLGYAHARGLVHRDVKPQNIMLRPDGTAKVTDFGIAKGLSDATLTEAGIGMGTVHYLSPEQARGEPASPASDLYAVGVLLYEALTGALPFIGDSAVGVAFKHVHETPAPPDRLNRAVPPPLAALTLHALEKDPGARFTSAREMAVALQHWRDWPVGGGALTRRGTVGGTRTLVPAGAARAPAATLIAPTPHRTALPATTRARRDGSGCVTWLVGTVVLAGLLGLLLAGYQLTESQGLAGVPRPTSTAARQAASSPVAPLNVASMPPATPTNAPTATPPPTVARAAASPATPLPSPTPAPSPTVTPSPSSTVMPSPTVTPSPLPTATPSPTATPQPTATPSPTTAPTSRPTPTSTPLPTPLPPTATPLPTATPAPTATATPRPPPPTPTIALVPVPDFAELTLAQARSAAARVGLEVEQVGEENSASVARGLVISQNPPSGEQVTPGGTVAVIVSRGPLTVAVPNVRGRPYEAAKAQLEGAGFEVVREDAPSPTVAAGAVIDQAPAPGRNAAPGAAVLLTVSRGDLVRVPDVTGLDYREAGTRLTAAGFTVSYNPQTRQQLQRENPAFSAANPNLRDGQVISQSLAPGGAYERGATINIAYFKR